MTTFVKPSFAWAWLDDISLTSCVYSHPLELATLASLENRLMPTVTISGHEDETDLSDMLVTIAWSKFLALRASFSSGERSEEMCGANTCEAF